MNQITQHMTLSLSNAIMWHQISCYLVLFNYFRKDTSKLEYIPYISYVGNRYLCMDTVYLHFKENIYI